MTDRNRSPTERLERQIADAALQDLLLMARKEDRKKEKDGWHFRYAAGADVVVLHADPEDHAIANENMAIGAGEVFQEDARERKIGITTLLGAFIWYELQRAAPILLVPPINLQLRRIVNGIGRKIVQEEQSAKIKIADIARRLDEGSPAAELIGTLNQIAMLEGPVPQLKRIRSLLDAGRLRSLDAGLPEGAFPPAFRQAARPFQSLLDQASLRSRISDWRERIIGARHRDGAADQRINEAAEAMARLQLINKRLSEIEDGKHRLLYITGDNSLLEAGDAIHDVHDGSFTRAYLRHPRAFLEEPGILRPAGAPSHHTALDEVLTLCLGRFADLKNGFGPRNRNDVPLSDDIKGLIASVIAKDPNVPEATWSKWRDASDAAARMVPPPSYLDMLLRTAMSNPERARAILERERPRIAAEAAAAWELFTDVVVQFRVVVELEESSQPREPPCLCFEGQPAVTTFFHAAESWLKNPSSFTKAEYDRHRAAIAQNDASGYFINLAHAWLLATQGQWRSAAILARRSAAAAPLSNHPVPAGPNGREARYLSAVCQRHAARSARELVGIEVELRTARDIAVAERGQAEDPDWPPDIVAERFQAERLALELTRLHFEWHEVSEGSKSRARIKMGFYATDIKKMIDTVSKNLTEVRLREDVLQGQGKRLPIDMPSLDQRETIRKHLLRRSHRNMFAIGLMAPGHLGLAEEAWQKLEAERENHPDTVNSGFANLLYNCGMALFSSDADLRNEALRKLRLRRAELRSTDERDLPKDLVVFPYDAARFIAWIDTVESR